MKTTIKILPIILMGILFCSTEHMPRDNEIDPKAENFIGFGDTTAPSAPSAVSTSATGATQVTLTWQPAADETDATSEITYQICMSETTGGCDSFTAAYTTNAGETSYNITGLTPETTYYFVVLAEDSAGNISTVTEEFSVTTSAGTISLTCGDSITDIGEDCDSGGVQSSSCEANCTTPVCGDGFKNEGAGEQCDGGGTDKLTCDSDCTLPACGDGHTNTAAGEECDSGGVQ
ncbi:MAG: fibronectin type III domain-containing protein, partial [Spirochaetia bacterium]|nr:fibronectin type III domain-containing protein [Spirochaetia bacterium]